jgi:sorting nexin-1/2
VRPQQPNLLPQNHSQQQIQQQVTTFSAVLRRYSDFLWLYERLHHERAGAIVPPLPEKQPVGRFSPTFVEDRRVQLERFLRRVAVHPELADAACLDLFLRADDVTFHAAKSIKKGGPASSGVYNNGGNINNNNNMIYPQQSNNMMQPSASPKKDGFKRWFAEAKTSMTGDLVKSPDDDIFDEIHRYIHGLDNQMRNVSHQATGLVRKGKEIANGLFEFGLAFNLLGQSEADALGDALAKMGETADRLSVLSAEQAEKEMAQFEEPLQDYIKMINAVKLALQRRHEKRLTYSTCLSEVESKQTQLGKLRAQIGQEGKAYALEMSLHRAREAAHVAQEDFATVSQRVLREVDRFKREKSEDMRRTVLDYINLQVEYNKRMEQVWAVLIPQLESVQFNTSGSSNAAGVQQQQTQQQPMPNMMMGQQQQQPPQYINTTLPPMPSGAPPMLPPAGSVPSPAMMAAGGVADPSMFAVQYRDS